MSSNVKGTVHDPLLTCSLKLTQYRLALLCFLWDTQHAVLFSQSLCMSAFELRVSLPCNPTTWEADSAEEWYNNFREETGVLFLSVLKIYVNPDSASLPAQLNALSQLLILHGLMSLSWDMKRRDQTSLGEIHLPDDRDICQQC